MPGMKNSADFEQALRRLGDALAREAGPATEQRLIAAFRARRNQSRHAISYWAILAAGLALSFVWFRAHHSPNPAQPIRPAIDNYASATAGFIALPYAQSDVPLEQAVIVRVKLQLAPASPSGTISADLLIGQDGVARAVRLVSVQ